MKPLGVLVLVIAGIAGLFFAINKLGDGSGEDLDSLESISQQETSATTDKGQETELTSPISTERSTVSDSASSGDRVELAPEDSEQFANSVTGLVMNPDQRPVSGARVVLTQAGVAGMIFQNEPLDRSGDRYAETDDEGRFSFLNVQPHSKLSIEADAKGYCRSSSSSFDVYATGKVEVPTLILTLGGSLAGTITDSGGNPVPDAKVVLEGLFSQFGEEAAPDSLTVLSEADGSYIIPNVPTGNRRLQISADGYANQTKGGLVFRGEEPLTMDVTLEIAEMICGRVISKLGSPVGEAKVLAMSFSNSNRQCRDEVLTDENGEFCLSRLAAGKYTIAVSAAGYRRQHEPRVQTGGAGLIIELEDQGQVTGRVTVSAGDLPKPYEVQLRQTHQGNTVTTLIGKSQLFNADDGSFSVECTQSGTYLVQAVAPGYAPSFSEEFRYTLGQPMSGVTVSLTAGGQITGRVVDGEGNPVPRPSITTHDNTWTNSLFDKALGDQFPTNVTKAVTTGNMKGKFRLELLKSETYQLTIRASGYCDGSMRDVAVTEGNETNVGDITLIKGGQITGTVIDLAGQPVPGAMVRLTLDERGRNLPQNYQTKSGANGKYTLTNVYPGKYKLTAARNSDPMDFLQGLSDELDRVQVVTISDGQSLRFELKVGQ